MITIGIERDMPIHLYNVALAVRRWTLKMNGGESDGFCGDASDEIMRRLKGTRYRPVFYDGIFRCNNKRNVEDGICFQAGHCWLQFGNLILDVTADQFNEDLKGIRMKPIVYGTRTELMRLYQGDPS
jgi:hypothetical protein